jgi:radical SAM superfamily enzyme YgiQ (UPF0313 family)
MDIEAASRLIPHTDRVFLADGNALCLATEKLVTVLGALGEAFPRLNRVGIYANGRDILKKSREELTALKRLGLGIIYLGLESGDDRVLQRVRKKDSSREMVDAVIKAKDCGILTSVIVLLGLGGKEGSEDHALLSAEAVSRMNPDYLSALTLMVVPGTPLYEEAKAGAFELPSQKELLLELRSFLENCRLEGCVFRTNHASNYLPLKGVLSRDKAALLQAIDDAIQRPEILRPEFMRGL